MITSEVLTWDTEFFGIKVARINKNCLSPKEFKIIYQELLNKDVKLIYWPSSIDCECQGEIANIYNGHLVDVKTTYSTKVNYDNINLNEYKGTTEILNINYPDEQLFEIAIQCGEYSRYKIDPQIPKNKFEELYKIWMTKSLSGEMADNVIVIKKNNITSGLITVYCKDGIGNIGLFGVHDNFRGKGIGGELINASLKYFKTKNCKLVKVVTQGKNEAACKLYEKFGFTVQNKVNFYHFWN